MTTTPLSPERWSMDPGSHAALVAAYAEAIGRVGYDAYTTNCLVAAARQLCAWAQLSGRTLDGVGDVLVRDFGRHDCQCDGARRGGPRSARYLFRVKRFIRFLVAQGVLATALLDDPYAQHVAPYLDWARKHRGLSEITLRCHAKGLRQLLLAIGTEPAAWSTVGLRSADSRPARAPQPRSAEADGHRSAVLAAPPRRHWAVRSGAGRGRSDHRQLEGPSTAARPAARRCGAAGPRLRSGDPDGTAGSGDSCSCAQLGLRAGGVQACVSTRSTGRGLVTLSGKGRREGRLPLPQEVGDALLAWLENGRPPVDDAHVFLRYAPPWRPFTESTAISKIVGRALDRASLENTPSRGAHYQSVASVCAQLYAMKRAGRLAHEGGFGGWPQEGN